MPTITIRNLDEDTKRNLQALAAMHGRSMEAEARQILREVASRKPGLIPEPHPPFAPDAPDRKASLATDRQEPPALNLEQPPAPELEAPFALSFDQPLVPGHKVGRPLIEEELISVVNRQLEKMGFPEFAIPANAPPA